VTRGTPSTIPAQVAGSSIPEIRPVPSDARKPPVPVSSTGPSSARLGQKRASVPLRRHRHRRCCGRQRACCWHIAPSAARRIRSTRGSRWRLKTEEGVLSEPVSESRKFPVSRENTGNFVDLRLASVSAAAKKGIKPEPYGPIPYAPEQGIFCALA